MSDIRIGVKGQILAGEQAGWYVLVQPGPDSLIGAFFVLTANTVNFDEEVYDGWVKSREDLDGYFAEAGWTIEWLVDSARGVN